MTDRRAFPDSLNRLYAGSVHRGDGHRDWLCTCCVEQDVFCVATCTSERFVFLNGTIVDFNQQAIKGIPTCYIFRCPIDARDPRPPFHALVPQGSREPGMILISHTGQIRFWDSIAIGLAGGENFAPSQLEDLEHGEEVTCFHRVDVRPFPSFQSTLTDGPSPKHLFSPRRLAACTDWH